MKKEEQWLDIPGFPPYKINRKGRVSRNGRELKLVYKKCNMPYCYLFSKGKAYGFNILRVLFACEKHIDPRQLEGYVFAGTPDNIVVMEYGEYMSKINTNRIKKGISANEGGILCDQLIRDLLLIKSYYQTGNIEILFKLFETHHKKVVDSIMRSYHLCQNTAEEYWNSTEMYIIEKIICGRIHASVISFEYIKRSVGSAVNRRRQSLRKQKLYNDAICSNGIYDYE